MKTYKLPCTWQMVGVVEVEAESLEEAEKVAIMGSPLPQGEYLGASFELDKTSDLYPVDDPFKVTQEEYDKKICEELEKLTNIKPIGDWHVPGVTMDEFLCLQKEDIVHREWEPVVLFTKEDGHDIIGVTTTWYLTKAINAVENLGLTVIEEE